MLKKTALATAGARVFEVYDFYGNLVKTNLLDDVLPIEIIPRKKENVFLVLRKDAGIKALHTVIRFCR